MGSEPGVITERANVHIAIGGAPPPVLSLHFMLPYAFFTHP